MEYKLSTDSTWTAATGNLTSLAGGTTYSVRYKAVTTTGSEAFASTAQTDEIAAMVVPNTGIFKDGVRQSWTVSSIADVQAYFNDASRNQAGNYEVVLPNNGSETVSAALRLRIHASSIHATQLYLRPGSTFTLSGEGPNPYVFNVNAGIMNFMSVYEDAVLKLGSNITINGPGTDAGGIGTTGMLEVRSGATLEILTGSNVVLKNHFSGYITSPGCAVQVQDGGTFTMGGGTISGNTSVVNGGGVLVGATGTFTKTGGTIYGATATGGNANTAPKGAAVYINASPTKYYIETDVTGNIGWNGTSTSGSGWLSE
jgi:hypothetical protein